MSFILVGIFSFVVLFAIVMFIAGVFDRDAQKETIGEYVRERKAVLLRLNEYKKRKREREEKRAAQEKKKLELPGDRRLNEDLKYMRTLATDSPQIMAKVLRTYLKSDQERLQERGEGS